MASEGEATSPIMPTDSGSESILENNEYVNLDSKDVNNDVQVYQDGQVDMASIDASNILVGMKRTRKRSSSPVRKIQKLNSGTPKPKRMARLSSE